jgi:AraC-like DNA-binding protein
LKRWCAAWDETANWILKAPRFKVDRNQRALELIKSGTPIAEIAADLGYASNKIFYNTFYRKMGATPTKWKIDNKLSKSIETRVSEAQTLLLSGRYSVKVVASLVGFRCSQALTMAFKRVHGLSAKHWLQQALATKALSAGRPDGNEVQIEWAKMPARGQRSR